MCSNFLNDFNEGGLGPSADLRWYPRCVCVLPNRAYNSKRNIYNTMGTFSLDEPCVMCNVLFLVRVSVSRRFRGLSNFTTHVFSSVWRITVAFMSYRLPRHFDILVFDKNPVSWMARRVTCAGNYTSSEVQTFLWRDLWASFLTYCSSCSLSFLAMTSEIVSSSISSNKVE